MIQRALLEWPGCALSMETTFGPISGSSDAKLALGSLVADQVDICIPIRSSDDPENFFGCQSTLLTLGGSLH